MGSLYAAAASYLDARAHGGRWLLRLEDLDRPREVAGAASSILTTLEAFGFQWDGACMQQSGRIDAYRDALETLDRDGVIFNCGCSRSQLADESRYPGICRAHTGIGPAGRAIRLRTQNGHIVFHDRVQGGFRQDVNAAIGDFVVRRRDGIFAYVLAVVVDDAYQAVTHVVRGADLLDNTPRQIYLQGLLGAPRPHYAHVPVLCEPGGAKLAKSRRSVALRAGGLDAASARVQLLSVLGLLGLQPPAGIDSASLAEIWTWAERGWSTALVPARLALHLTG